MDVALMHERENGIYYTPSNLADYLVKPLINQKTTSILDPSYGEGSLLLAAERIHALNPKIKPINLFGCDIKPVNGLLKHLPEANLKKINFFDYPLDNKFSTILMNPPYVRHHLQVDEIIAKLRFEIPDLNIISNVSDLWAYFIVKATLHLKNQGNIGAILPWSFLQADYAKPLRGYLARHFRNIKLLTLSEKYFEKAQERVVLVWLIDYGKKCETINLGYAKGIKQAVKFEKLPLEDWVSDKVSFAGANSAIKILEKCKNNFGFTDFSNVADVRIGVVTGADKFFVLSKPKAKELKISSKHLMPIVTSSKQFVDILNKGKIDLKQLLLIKKSDYSKYQGYIAKGKKESFHLRAHSMERNPWYGVNSGNMPDAFFPYRTKITPYLLINNLKIQCTNSVHRIYFKNLTDSEIKWVQVSLLSSIGQLSIEVSSKTYGKGVLKIEPKSLKQAIVLRKDDPEINKIYELIQDELKKNNKPGAMKIASSYIYKALSIPVTLQHEIETLLARLQQSRLSYVISPKRKTAF